MSTIARLVVSLGLATEDYKAGLDEAERAAQSKAQVIGDRLSGIGDKMTALGGKMTLGVTLPVVGGMVASVMAASDLNETMSKSQVVFGDAANKIAAFGDTAAQSFGMSKQSAVDAASTFGNLFVQSAGQTKDSAADMSKNLVMLAGDLASFNNLDPSLVLEKLRSGLVGETEPLRSLGVTINEAKLQTEGLAAGFLTVDEKTGKVTGSLDASQKMLLTYKMILDQTTTAHGDFERTSDGLANQMRITKAQFTDAAANLGTQLLPYAIELVNTLSKAVSWFTSLDDTTKRNILVFAGLAAAIGPVLTVVGSLVSTIGALVPVISVVLAILSGPVGIVIAAVIAVVAGLYLAWSTNFLGIRDIVAGFIAWLSPIWDATLKNFQDVFAAFQLAFSGDWRGFGEKIRDIWDRNWELLKGAFMGAWESLKAVDWGAVGLAIIQGIANGITGGAQFIVKAAQGVGSAAVEAIKGFLGIKSPSTVFMDIGAQMMRGLALGIENNAGLPNVSMSVVSTGVASNVSGSGGEFAALRGLLSNQARPATASEIAIAVRDAVLMAVG